MTREQDAAQGSIDDAEPITSGAAAPVEGGALRPGRIADDEFRLLADNIPTLCWMANGDGYIVWYNRRWHEYCGTTPAQMEGWGWQSVHDPELLPQVMERWTASIATGEPFEMTFPLKGADGVFRPFLTRIQPVRDAGGKVVRWFGVNTEISAQVAAEEALRESGVRFAALFEQAPTFMAMLRGPEHVFELANPSYLKLIGQREIIGRTVADALPEAAAQGYVELLDEVYRSGKPYAANGARYAAQATPGGPVDERYVDFVFQPITDGTGAVSGIFVEGFDVTDRKTAEAKVAAASARHEALAAEQAAILGQLAEGVIVADREGRLTFVNEAAERLHGVKRLDVTPDEYSETYHLFTETGEPYPPAQLPLARAVMRGETVVDARWRIRRPDGSEILAIGSARPILGAHGAQTGSVLTLRDDTERRRGEEALRESEEFNRRVLASSGDCIKVLGLDGRLESMSEGGMFVMEVEDFSRVEGSYWPDFWPGEERGKAIAAIEAAQSGRAGRFQGFAPTAKDTPRWWDVVVTPINGGDGCPEKLLSISRDITATKNAEAALRESEERLRLVVDGASDYAILTIDPERRITSWSRGAENIFGYCAEEAIGRSSDMLFTPEDREAGRPQQEVESARAAGCANDERWHIRSDGGLVFMNGSVHPLPPHEDGSERGFIKIARDETGRRRSDAALRESEERLRMVQAAGGIGSFDYDLTRDEAICSPEYYALLGLPEGSAITRETWLQAIHPEDRDKAMAVLEQSIAQGKPFDYEYRIIRADNGEVRWLSGRANVVFDADGRPWRYVGGNVDVTDRRAAEEAVREQSRTLETLNRSGAALAAELDLERLVQQVTDAGVELTGAQFGAFFHNVINEAGESYMLYSLSGAHASQFDFGMPSATAVFHPTFAGEGVLRSDDITADPRYGRNAPHFGLPKGHLPVRSYLAVSVIGRSGEVMGGLFFGHEEAGRFSERHEQLMTGIAAQAAIAMDNARLFQTVQRELASREKAEQELRVLNETLEQRVAAEVARRGQAEEALRQAQKMETLGQLTGGVAHDFNNLLQIVSGNLEILQRNLPPDEPRLRRAAENAARGAERAAVLTQRLLAFSRRQPLAPKPVDANRLVTGMLDLLHRSLGETIAVETRLAPSLWPVEADPNQLENAILNLAVNARDAMDGGGKLIVATGNAQVAEEGGSGGAVPGDYVTICVADSGCGMDRETVERAFEPFFTTKEVGKGTGLGLSMVYGFVKQSGGDLAIESEPGRGTSVTLYLPRREGEGAPAEVEADEPAPERARDETILVCEDDEDVRSYTVEVLRELGYRVIEAQDGPTARRLLERKEERIDLLFTDVVLPGGMTGAELAREAAALRPRLKVLFTTGYARDAIVHKGRLDEGVELITKPFAYGDLAARVRDMLDGGQ
jgi:PAS domain S-box-containing protein